MGANGVLAIGVPYPAVARKQTRIRMIVTSEMTKAQLDKGYNELRNAIEQSKLEEMADSITSVKNALNLLPPGKALDHKPLLAQV